MVGASSDEIPSDEELLAQIAKGHRGAFTSLMRRHGTYSRRTQRLVAGTGASLGGLGLLLLALRDLT